MASMCGFALSGMALWLGSGCGEKGFPQELDTAVEEVRDAGAGAGPDAGSGIRFEPGLRKRVFLHRNGSLGKIRDSSDLRPSLEVADAECARGASTLGLTGLWKAWLSSSTAEAIDRIEDRSPWYRLDQTTLLFATKSELTQGPRNRIDPSDTMDEWTACAPGGTCRFAFWSGTTLEGHRTTDTCLDWTAYLGRSGTVGRADVAGSAWAAPGVIYCGAYLGLLCIEQ
jgi:hypothetical protein